MDRRQQKTRAAIFHAFEALLEKKNYNHITVQEIIDTANIGRSTFYAHFETKDDLLRTMCTDIFHHVFSENLEQEKGHDFSTDNYGIEKKITHILYHLKENQNHLRGILGCAGGDLFMEYFKHYLFMTFPDYLETEKTNLPPDFLLDHVVCSFTETVRWWILKHPHFSPEEVAVFFLATLPDSFLKNK